jgi:hypothetical protein
MPDEEWFHSIVNVWITCPGNYDFSNTLMTTNGPAY